MASHAEMDMTSENSATLLNSSSPGEGSHPQDYVLSVNKDPLSSRGHQKSCKGLNRKDVCSAIQSCLMPASMSQFFGGHWVLEGGQTLCTCHAGLQPQLGPF